MAVFLSRLYTARAAANDHLKPHSGTQNFFSGSTTKYITDLARPFARPSFCHIVMTACGGLIDKFGTGRSHMSALDALVF